jgi:transmembrane sensor
LSEPTNQTPELDPLTHEALEWVIRLKSGEATVADGAALQHWRGQSAAHENAFREAVELWRTLGAVAREISHDEQVARPLARRLLGRRALLGGAIAASAAGYLIVRPPLDLWPSLAELSADYRTAKGEMRHLALEQDVSLEMNTLTSIAVRSTQQEERIELISGEATIRTGRAASKPLVLIAAGGRITAVDANFNARCIGGAVSVTCVNGEVEVEQGAHSVRLVAGMQVGYSADGMANPVAVDPAHATAWRNGLLIFENRPLAQVIEEVNRYRPGKIILANGSLGGRLVSGTFHLDRLDDVIGQVMQAFGAHVTTLPAGVVLLS